MESAPHLTSAVDGNTAHKDHSRTGVNSAQQAWHDRVVTANVQTHLPCAPVCDAAFVFDSAKQSQRKEHTFKSVVESSSQATSVATSTAASQQEARTLLRPVKQLCDSTGWRAPDKLQREIVERVAN